MRGATAHSMLTQEVNKDGSSKEKSFPCKKNEETLQRMEAGNSHQHCKVPSVRRAHSCIPRMQFLRLLQGRGYRFQERSSCKVISALG